MEGLLTVRGGGTLSEIIEGEKAPIGAEGVKDLMRPTEGQAPLSARGGTILLTFSNVGARALATLGKVGAGGATILMTFSNVGARALATLGKVRAGGAITLTMLSTSGARGGATFARFSTSGVFMGRGRKVQGG